MKKIIGAPATLAILLAAGCEAGEATLVTAEACRVAQGATPLPAEVDEASGAAVSRRHAGVIWTHNDSGSDPHLFAVDASGQLLGRFTVAGARNVDWEDIAIGPCGGADCLYVADVGDNDGSRQTVDVYRIREPDPTGSATEPLVAERFSMRYPDGPRDAEGIFVLPPEEVHVVTRGRGAAIAIYRYPGPLRAGETVTLTHLRALSGGPVPHADQVTAADATADGDWIGLRTPSTFLLYRAETLLAGETAVPASVDIGTLGEPQGEGLAFGPDGTVILTSEAGEGGMLGSFAIVWCPSLGGG